MLTQIICQSATQLQASIHLNQFAMDDLTTWNHDTAYLTRISYGGVTPIK
jgi:hypothetical protein